MSISIRIHEEIYNEAKKAAAAEYHSIPKQIEFWAKLGKCALDNPDLPIEFIKDLLIARRQEHTDSEPFNFQENND